MSRKIPIDKLLAINYSESSLRNKMCLYKIKLLYKYHSFLRPVC